MASWEIMRFEGRDQMLLFWAMPTFIWDSRRKDRLHADLKYTYFADRWQPLQSEHIIIKLCHCQWHYYLTDCLNLTCCPISIFRVTQAGLCATPASLGNIRQAMVRPRRFLFLASDLASIWPHLIQALEIVLNWKVTMSKHSNLLWLDGILVSTKMSVYEGNCITFQQELSSSRDRIGRP